MHPIILLYAGLLEVSNVCINLCGFRLKSSNYANKSTLQTGVTTKLGGQLSRPLISTEKSLHPYR